MGMESHQRVIADHSPIACRFPSVSSMPSAVGLVVLLSCVCLTVRSAERPNILFCFADDLGRIASIYGKVDGKGSFNDLVATPNLDRLARGGVVFRNAFVNAPSCTPCRSSLLTGQHFWRTNRGAILQGAVWDDAIPTFPLLLRGSGYHLGKMYKVWSPGTPADQPYGGQQHAFEKAGRRFNNFSENVTAAVAEGIALEAAKQALYDEVAANFDAFLAAQPKDSGGQRAPFCFWFGPTNVHRKWIKGSGRALWNLDPDRLSGLLPPFLPDVPEVREDFADYLGEVMAFDHAVGVLLKRLEERGELERTLVVVSGDHGPPGFTHGKCDLYDFGTRVPLIVHGAGTAGRRVIDDPVSLPDLAPTFLELGGVARPAAMTATSLVPLLRSEASGVLDPARDHVLIGRERHVEDGRPGNVGYPQRAIRTAEHLYIINFAPDRHPLGDPYRLTPGRSPAWDDLANDTRVTYADMDAGPTKAWLVLNREQPAGKPFHDLAFARRPREELYLLASDPHQLCNVAQEPRYAQVRAGLERRLLDALRAAADPRVVDSGCRFDKPPFVGPIPGRK
jgi:N-sulfoglucosamine sulfohydrolase